MRSAREAVDCARSDCGAATNRIVRQSAKASWKKRLLLCKLKSSRQMSRTCALLGVGESLAGMQIFKLDVQDRIFVPVFVIEVPPLVLVNGEAFRFHGAAKQIAVPALERSAARIVGKGARRHFVIRAWHCDGFA